MAGLDPETLPARRLINVIYTLLVDDGDALTNRDEIRASIETSMEKLAPDRETWGTGKRAQQGQDALMKQLEG